MSHARSKNTSELEQDNRRSSDLGYALDSSHGFLKYTEHGAPHPLIRWHHHNEYELHLITATSGKMFVGDYIGDFKPGNLVLTGPNLPHNWVSCEIPDNGIVTRDISLHFLDKPFREACKLLPEMSQIIPLLDRAKHGIEFFGISEYAKQKLFKIKNKEGIFSFNEFLMLMSVLCKHEDYHLLSFSPLTNIDSKDQKRINEAIDYINKNYSSQLSMSVLAEQRGMDKSNFSRSFKKVTGITFTDFVSRVRINRACQLLTETNMYISTIGYHVGYNNVANFNRRFVEIKQSTPSKYRKQSQYKFS